MAAPTPGVLRRAADRALTVGALLGLAALLSAALGAALGVRPLFFRSGSMAPTIETGSLALARSVPATDLHAGDVVSVSTASGTRVTHRVVRVDTTSVPGQAALTLRGDANKYADPERYAVASAYRVFWHAPRLGYVVGTALSPSGLVSLGLLFSALLLLVPRSGGGPRAGGRHALHAPAHRRLRAAGVTAVASAAVLAGPAGPASAAPWTDDVAVAGATLTAKTVAPTVVACGTLNVGSTTLTWSPVTGATGYTLHYGTGGATTETVGSGTTSKTFSGVATSGDFSVTVNVNYGSTTWSSVPSNVKHYTVVLLVVGVCTDA